MNNLINQFGDNSIYVERNVGQIFIGGNFIEEPTSAFSTVSSELKNYTATITPHIHRDEVNEVVEWIAREAEKEGSSRLALVYGKAGAGKSVVMHDVLEALQVRSDYLVLGLKSDQIAFVDKDDLARKMHLAKPIQTVIEEMARKYQRVVLLVDQIDALSLSLSANRTPLRSLLNLIKNVHTIHNVRVVISCRPYDLEYDPLLDTLEIKHKWEIKDFTRAQVEMILAANHREQRVSDSLLSFLGNPLNLYLFLKVDNSEQLPSQLSVDVLYHQLWRKYILDNSVRTVDKSRLLSLLDNIVSKMYERQELAVHSFEFETEHDQELQYLLTNGLLLKTGNGHIQFFHQTLFDYVYARRFIESGKKLLDVLKNQHQGFFIRSSVKIILAFLREKNHKDYLATIDRLIFAKDQDRKDVFRYHLKSLAISNMVYTDYPFPDELNWIERKLFTDETYMELVFDSVNSRDWFNAIWREIDKKGGWKALTPYYREKAIQMSRRAMFFAPESVLDIVEREMDFNDDADRDCITSLFPYTGLNCGSERIIAVYNKLVRSRLPLENVNLLRCIMETDPGFVCRELKENIRLQLESKTGDALHPVSINANEWDLYREMIKRHKDEAFQLFVDILYLLYSRRSYNLSGGDILNTSSLFTFERERAYDITSNFEQGAINILLDLLLDEPTDKKTVLRLNELSWSKYDGFVFAALLVFTCHPEVFHDSIFELLTNRQVLCNAPCWVEYQAVEALKAGFEWMNETEKKSLIDRILDIDDKLERSHYWNDLYSRLEYGHPVSDIDKHKGKALEVIPQHELKRLSWSAYQERLRINRKFNHLSLENVKPSSITVYCGWSSLKESKGVKMSLDAWYKSMLVYTDDHCSADDRPTLTGQCNLFRSIVGKEPDRFMPLLNDILSDEKVLIQYPLSGMRGLLDAGRTDDAMTVLEGILDAVGRDVNSSHRGFDIRSLLIALDDVLNGGSVPEAVLDLLCDALLNVHELDDDIHSEGTNVGETGINQARGKAGFMLVKCAGKVKDTNRIFDTIEAIADSASVYTRAAILINMAVLNCVDSQRNVVLFKKLMHDFDPRLMALAVHDYNPLVYFVNYAAEDLMEFFEHASNCPSCYPQQVIILWLAWSHNGRDERIKLFLDRMCDSSQEARLSLLRFFAGLDDLMDDAVGYILHILESQFDSKEIGDACDYLFYNANKWRDDVQKQLANAFVASPASKHALRGFIDYLAAYAIRDPVQTLIWLEEVVFGTHSFEAYELDKIVDVLIQAYNGIKSFNDVDYQSTLESAMDMMDHIMRNSSNRHYVSNYLEKLDND